MNNHTKKYEKCQEKIYPNNTPTTLMHKDSSSK